MTFSLVLCDFLDHQLSMLSCNDGHGLGIPKRAKPNHIILLVDIQFPYPISTYTRLLCGSLTHGYSRKGGRVKESFVEREREKVKLQKDEG